MENRPTEMIQFAQTLGAIGLNMLATSNLRYPTQKIHLSIEEGLGEIGKDYSIFMLGLYYLARLWKDISIHFRR